MTNKIQKRCACLDKNVCVACGCCAKACPFSAATVFKGMYAVIDRGKCVGCGKCAKACPAGIIAIGEEGR